MNYYEQFDTQVLTVDKIISGWLAPNAEFYPCRWGKHTDKAFDVIEKLGIDEEFWEYEHKTCTANVRDWLVLRNFILLDNPSDDKKTQYITYNTIKKRTKAQEKWLLERGIS